MTLPMPTASYGAGPVPMAPSVQASYGNSGSDTGMQPYLNILAMAGKYGGPTSDQAAAIARQLYR